MRKSEPKKIGESLSAWLKKMRLEQGVQEVEVRTLWAQIVGPGVDESTEQIKLKGDILYVKLSSDALRQELTFAAEGIIKHLNQEIPNGRIKRIQFH